MSDAWSTRWLSAAHSSESPRRSDPLDVRPKLFFLPLSATELPLPLLPSRHVQHGGLTGSVSHGPSVSWGSFFENRILPPDFDDARKRTEQREDRLMGRITKR